VSNDPFGGASHEASTRTRPTGRPHRDQVDVVFTGIVEERTRRKPFTNGSNGVEPAVPGSRGDFLRRRFPFGFEFAQQLGG